MGWLYEGGEELLLARSQRRREAENQIRVLTNILDIHPSPNATDDKAWASDGSMVPASAGILDDKTVTAALTGHRTMVMRLQGRNSNILHGEIFGIIMGHILIPQTGANDDRHLFTDHLNTACFLQDSQSNINQDAALRYRNGRSYLRWLKLLSEESSTRRSRWSTCLLGHRYAWHVRVLFFFSFSLNLACETKAYNDFNLYT